MDLCQASQGGIASGAVNMCLLFVPVANSHERLVFVRELHCQAVIFFTLRYVRTDRFQMRPGAICYDVKCWCAASVGIFPAFEAYDVSVRCPKCGCEVGVENIASPASSGAAGYSLHVNMMGPPAPSRKRPASASANVAPTD